MTILGQFSFELNSIHTARAAAGTCERYPPANHTARTCLSQVAQLVNHGAHNGKE